MSKRKSAGALISSTPEKKTMPVNGITRFLREFAETVYSSTNQAMILPLWEMCIGFDAIDETPIGYLSQIDVLQIALASKLWPATDGYEFIRDHSEMTGLAPDFTLPRHFMQHAIELLVRCPTLSVDVFQLCMTTSSAPEIDSDDDSDAEFSEPAVAIALYHAVIAGNRPLVKAILSQSASDMGTDVDWYFPRLLIGHGHFIASSSRLGNEWPCVVQFFRNNKDSLALGPHCLSSLCEVALNREGECQDRAVGMIQGIAAWRPRDSLQAWFRDPVFECLNALWPMHVFDSFDMDMALADETYHVRDPAMGHTWSEVLDRHDSNFPLMQVVVPRLFLSQSAERVYDHRPMLKSKALCSPNIASIVESLEAVVG